MPEDSEMEVCASLIADGKQDLQLILCTAACSTTAPSGR